MSCRFGTLFVMLGLALPALAAAAVPPELATLFPRLAPLLVDDRGLVRLDLPAEVLTACRADLSDLRIVDRNGREVPYVLDSGRDPGTEIEAQRSLVPEVLEVRREKRRRETGPPIFSETFEIEVPTGPDWTAGWELVIAAPRETFVRRLSVDLLKRDGVEILLVEEASIFRLGDPARIKSRLPLPGLAAGRLRVAIEGEEGDYLEPTFRLETRRSLGPGSAVTVDLAELDQRQVEGATIFELARPRGLVPELLALETATGNFRRRVRVWDLGPPVGEELVADGTLSRLQAQEPLAELELTLRPTRGNRLRVRVEDGDSPPLEGARWQVVVRRPALIFSVGAVTEGPAGTLLFGGGRALRPRYDLAELLPDLTRPARDEEARIGESLYDSARLGRAVLGEPQDNPSFDPTPALAFAMRPGKPLDDRRYTHRQAIEASPSPEGLVRLPLPLATAARAGSELADLRIVDDEQRQWPYLMELGTEEVLRPLAVGEPVSRDRQSTYGLTLPASQTTVSEIRLDSNVAFFDREATLIGEVGPAPEIPLLDRGAGGDDEIELARQRLVRQAGQQGPVAIAFSPRRVSELELRVRDGDDSPLAFSAAEGRFSVPVLYFAAPAGRYYLLLGFPEEETPRYEIARVRDVILTVNAGSAALGPLEENPTFSRRARLGAEGGVEQAILWLALALAAGVLTVLTLRLARREPAEGS